ncbi:MAG: ATP-binding protein [Planctomycetes bacterium]|nr:ATP-binding protein [Planctomycetota bacterium]
MTNVNNLDGVFEPDLRLGVVSTVEATSVRVNLHKAGSIGGSLHRGTRYGLGEVGEFVLIETELAALLGRIIEVRLPESERLEVSRETGDGVSVNALARVQLLGTVALSDLSVTAGIASHPRLGDRVYSAPDTFLASVALRMERGEKQPEVTLKIGTINSARDADVRLTPERLFGRHCAVLGATGGGKSFTVSRLIEECLHFKSKVILIDATGEYRDLNAHTSHVYLGTPTGEPSTATKCALPYSGFTESDFLALFEPAGKTQGPKLRAAIRSLRLVKKVPRLTTAGKPGLLVRANRRKQEILSEEAKPEISRLLDDPTSPFDPSKLASQIQEECVWETAFVNRVPSPDQWGDYDGNTFSYCMSLLTRINGVLVSKALECVFGANQGPSITERIDQFLEGSNRLLRISLEGIYFEFSAREIIANALGRYLLQKARTGAFRKRPVVVFVDEAHNFLGRNLGGEDSQYRLDAFELISKEGRKYGLNLCLATQRPRDITEGVLSQIGTLIVHRLTNDKDREVVERACGEIDGSAAAFLPTLEPGEAAVVGVDFPIPLTVKINEPSTRPASQGAQFQAYWTNSLPAVRVNASGDVPPPSSAQRTK